MNVLLLLLIAFVVAVLLFIVGLCKAAQKDSTISKSTEQSEFIDECDCCGCQASWRDVEIVGTQVLCKKCKQE